MPELAIIHNNSHGVETGFQAGQADILIDGTRVATIDTYQSDKQHRTVGWTTRRPKGDGHTLTVVDKATPGRPRTDIDAVLLN